MDTYDKHNPWIRILVRLRVRQIVLLLAMFFFVVAAGRATFVWASGTAHSRIVCDEPSFDWGTANPGATVSHTFSIVNRGRAPLLITDVRTTCGCMLVSPPSEMVGIGESAPISVSLAVGHNAGNRQAWVLVESNDPRQPLLALR